MSSMSLNLAPASFLTDDVCAEIRLRTSGQVRNLCLQQTAEGLRLTGRSGTFYAKQLAQHAVKMLAPTLPLINEIVVGEVD